MVVFSLVACSVLVRGKAEVYSGCYLMNIGKNSVKNPTTSKKKLLPVAKADVHLAQASESGIKNRRRESMAVAPKRG